MLRIVLSAAVLSLAALGCGSSTESCQGCDKAGKLEFCVDCPDDVNCTKTIREKVGGAVKFTCTEKSGGGGGKGCVTDKLVELCN